MDLASIQFVGDRPKRHAGGFQIADQSKNFLFAGARGQGLDDRPVRSRSAFA
jgi:hypothetical protein